MGEFREGGGVDPGCTELRVRLRRYARQLGAKGDDAEDLVQAALCHAVELAKEYTVTERLLRAVMVCDWLDEVDRKAPVMVDDVVPHAESAEDSFFRRHEAEERRRSAQQLLGRVEVAMPLLSRLGCDTIRRLKDGATAASIAEDTGITLRAAKLRISNARAELRGMLRRIEARDYKSLIAAPDGMGGT